MAYVSSARLLQLVVACLVLAALAVACDGGPAGEETPAATRTPDGSQEGTQVVSPGEGATLIVDSTLDTNKRDDALTLREALLLATDQLLKDELDGGEKDQVEGDPGAAAADMIQFDESIFSAEEPGVIALDSALPAMSTGGDSVDGMDAVIIDGQDKSLTCFTLTSDDNRLKGLRTHSCRTAVLVEREVARNVIGGAGEGNVLSGNVVGVELRGRETVIAGNIIGLDASGTGAMSNEFEGIWITNQARDNMIGGPGPGEGNVISGNDLFGVSVDGSVGTVLQGNVFGLDLSGRTGVRNRYAIVVQAGAVETLIGGAGAGERNVIAGNNTGILVRDEETQGNSIVGNYIGTDIDGELAISNVVDIWFVVGREKNVLEDNLTLEPLDIEEGSP